MFDLARKYAARGLVLASVAAGAVLISSPADARGYGWHGGGGWGWGFGGGVLLGAAAFGPWGPGYYGPGYYGYYPYYADPPVTVIQQPVMVAPQVQQAQAPATYYYCDEPAGYYPYVQNCGRPWRPVPATPPAAVAAPPPPPPQ